MKSKSLITTAIVATLSCSAALAIETQSVTFESHGDNLQGTLYLPDNPTTPLSAVVITGAWMTVKEQMPRNYATALAARGYAALTFDFRGWGESEGTPRFLESPTRKTEDIIAAAKFLASHELVDPARLSGLGICASAGYMADAAIRSANLQSIALVAPWLHDAAIVDTVYGGAAGVAALVEKSRKAEAADTPMTVPGAGTVEEGAIMTQAPYYTDPERGLIPEWGNTFNLASWEPWLTYDAIASAPRLTKPLLIVHSEAAAIPDGARKYLEKTAGPSSAVWIENRQQMDFYDDPELIETAVEAVDNHLQKPNPDTAAVRSVIEGVAVLADLGEFDALQTLFAPEVRVDYTSAFGGEVETKSREALMATWTSLLPGFDRTRHELSDITVEVDGTTATGSANAIAAHWLGDDHWQISGSYHYEFSLRESWEITSLRFVKSGEKGDPTILSAAASRAADAPPQRQLRD